MALDLKAEAAQAAERRKQENRAMMNEILTRFVHEVNAPELSKLAGAQVDSRTAMEKAVQLLESSLTETVESTAENQREMLLRSQRPLVLLFLVIAAASLVMLGVLLKRPPATAIPSGQTAEQIAQVQAETDSLKAQVATLTERVSALRQQEATTLERLQRAQDALQKASLAGQALSANREAEQSELERLLRLNQSFQFRLSPTNSGEVVVEIPPTAQPFTVDGRRYITVTQPTP